jgi:hypothetical protein
MTFSSFHLYLFVGSFAIFLLIHLSTFELDKLPVSVPLVDKGAVEAEKEKKKRKKETGW